MSLKNFLEQVKPTTCNICGGKVILIKVGKEHSSSEFIYKCTECGASVGTHVCQPDVALGTLADLETKKKRRECHVWFDKLWSTHEEREEYYQRLANELGITRQQCHFGLMEMEMLEKALEIIKKWWWIKYDM